MQYYSMLNATKNIINCESMVCHTSSVDGALDGVEEEEEGGDEEPAAGAQFLVLAAEHDAPVAEEEEDYEQRDGHGPEVLLQGGAEAEAHAHEKGVGAGGEAHERDSAPARNVEDGGIVALGLAEGLDEHAERHCHQKAEEDEVVVFRHVEAQDVAQIDAQQHQQHLLGGDDKGDQQAPRETHAHLVGTGAEGQQNGQGQREGEDDIFKDFHGLFG